MMSAAPVSASCAKNRSLFTAARGLCRYELLLLVPVGLLVAAIIAGELLRGSGVLPGGSGVSVLAGFVLMALWYVGVSLYDRRLRRGSKNQPVIAVDDADLKT